ncbi:hypothetical protein H6G54_05790 [Anabaena cylindrica FACHB-243]|uniref:Uncharacterized protein n=1 Tax=Anabaena cylindrica (strain ATCC 27899 / PCC 7122) TaxID=272123 RepID=K9ZNC5_ANACC|nr:MULTISPECIES: hypothetical protein [Anabaena]AFZ59830.1 hypothetical protein Anacy_4472 [Anabaena cylindrica PCC 7122]MBD2417229.1 hypothetical protein [Anabaena cylindrica FACHB-243]MBY5282313.1 hypothetical protein [Anabaena sp. CCAP 1446/1C]MBY5309761.1 hypothetical protein [Anabaena sp. CCAP 1446/1C]MCM2404955.1 hypothetical protein [Anabaena sp. CCAP 1446/1C]
MKPIQQYQRCASAQEFQKSLTQLEDILEVNSTHHQVVIKPDASSSINDQFSENSEEISLDALEDAVADIEQYLDQKNKRK